MFLCPLAGDAYALRIVYFYHQVIGRFKLCRRLPWRALVRQVWFEFLFGTLLSGKQKEDCDHWMTCNDFASGSDELTHDVGRSWGGFLVAGLGSIVSSDGFSAQECMEQG